MKMNKVGKGAKLLVPIVLAIFSWGCASTQETSNLQENVNTLYQQVQSLQARMQGMESQQQKIADLYAQLEALQVTVGNLSGQFQAQQHLLQQQASASPSTAAAGSQGTSSTGTVTSTSISEGSSAAPSGSTASSSTVTGGIPKITITQQSQPQKPKNPQKALYNKALQSFQQGKFVAARQTASDFLNKYPQSNLADNVQYLIAESYYSQKRYQDAISSFQQLLDRYPKANKVPSALLKQGAAFHQLGDDTAAQILYDKVVNGYPGTPQAQAAAKRLKELGQQ